MPDPRLGWRLNPAYPDVDAWGFRNEAVPRQADILVLGDSQSYGYGVAPQDAWPQRLGQLRERSTYTVASSEFSPLHGFVIWDEIARLRPQIVVAAFYAGNDLYDVFQLVHRRGQLPELPPPQPGQRARIETLEADSPLSRRARHVTRLGRPTWPLRDWLRDHSRFYHLVRALGRRSEALGAGTESADWDSARRRAAQHPAFLYAFDGGDGRRTVFTVAKRLLPLNTSDLRIAEGLRLTLAALPLIADRVSAAKARLLVLWIPTKEAVFAHVAADHDDEPADFDRLLAAEERVRRQLRDAVTTQGLPFVDAGPALRASLDGGQQPYPVDDNGHPVASGCLAIAKAVAAAVDDL
jgi:hypothetical protein